jgi:SpoVK/Ycf46/Vps4 family AAA+-type ATPase
MGVFLAILDGAKRVENLKVIAATNLKSKMDEAFLRRMDIQIFIGNPGSSSRLTWLEPKSKNFIIEESKK